MSDRIPATFYVGMTVHIRLSLGPNRGQCRKATINKLGTTDRSLVDLTILVSPDDELGDRLPVASVPHGHGISEWHRLDACIPEIKMTLEVQPLKIGDKIHVIIPVGGDWEKPGVCRPGIVTEVWDTETGRIDLIAFTVPEVDETPFPLLRCGSFLPGFGAGEWHSRQSGVALPARH